MQHGIKILLITGIIFLVLIPGIFAQTGVQQAIIRDLSGTVEIRQSGSEEWQSAGKGQILDWDTTISTGFRSSALIALGNSLLTVRPLTRLTLSELSLIQDTETVQLKLQTGRVRAEVKAPAGAKAQFTIQSPTATASVRGTVFEFDTVNLSVSEGTVAFNGAANAGVLIDAGRFSFSDERTGQVALPETITLSELRPELPIASDGISQAEKTPETGGTSGGGGDPPISPSGITVTVGF